MQLSVSELIGRLPVAILHAESIKARKPRPLTEAT